MTKKQNTNSEYYFPKLFVGRSKIIRNLLKQVDSSCPSKKNIIIGLPGMGKSSLLDHLFYLIKSMGIPVSKIDGHYYDEPLSILQKIVSDYAPMKFQKFSKGVSDYKRILKKLVESELISLDLVAFFSNNTIVEAQYSAGMRQPASDTFSQRAIESALESINKLLKPAEINLLFKTQDVLTDLFIADLSQHTTNGQKVVLLLDTYDELNKISSWLVDGLVQNLPLEIMLVVAGRKLPVVDWTNSWMGPVNFFQLDVLTDSEMEQYLRKKGVKDKDLIKAVIQFSKGLPLALSLSTDLVSRFGLLSFKRDPKQQEVIRTLTQVILREIQDSFLIEALEFCAVLKYFDESDIGFFFGKRAQQVFDDISQLSFVTVQQRGLSLHELIRQYILQDLEWRDPNRLRKLHQKAGDLYFNRLKQGEKDTIRMNRLRVYHLIRADEAIGLKLLQSTIDQLIQYRYFGQMDTCEAFLSETDGYEFSDINNRITFKLMKAEIYLFQTRFRDAQAQYHRLLALGVPDLSLLSKVEFGYGEVLFRQNIYTKSRLHFTRSAEILSELGQIETLQYAQVLHSIGDTFRSEGNAIQALEYYTESLNISQKTDNWFRIADTLHMIATTYRVLCFDYENSIKYINKAIIEIQKTTNESAIGWIFIHKGYIYALLGELDKAYSLLEVGQNLIEKYKIPIYYGWAKTAIGYYHYRIKKYSDAKMELLEGIDLFKKGNAYYHKASALLHLCELLFTLKEEELGSRLTELKSHVEKYQYHDVSIRTDMLMAKARITSDKLFASARSVANALNSASVYNEHYVNFCIEEFSQLLIEISNAHGKKSAKQYLNYVSEHTQILGNDVLRNLSVLF